MSDPDRALNLIYAIGLLVLAISAVVAHRLPLGRTLKMAVAWLLIFAALFTLFAAKDELLGLGRRALGGDKAAEAEAAREIRIRKAPDGHFWADARINGVAVRFLIDSGATVTSISRTTADRAGIDYHGGFPAMVETANGLISVRRGRAETLRVGTIVRKGMAVHVADSFEDMDVLGMNFLSSLKSWGVEGRFLVLRA